jgi:signal transduction histidine kinase
MMLQTLLIILPIVVLAGLGFQTLHKDRLLLEHEAKRQADALAADGLERLWTYLSQADASRPSFRLSPDGQLIQPVAYTLQPTPSASLEKLTSQQEPLWSTADSTSDAERWRAFLASEPPASWKERARYALALALHAKNEDDAALATFHQVGTDDPRALTAAGVPIVPLARWKEVELVAVKPNSSSQLEQALKACLGEAVTNASILTPTILDRATALAGEHAMVDLSFGQQWQRDELSRALCQCAAQSHAGHVVTDWPSMFYCDDYLIVRQQHDTNAFAAFAPTNQQGEALLTELATRVPANMKLNLEIVDPSTNSIPIDPQNLLAVQSRGDTRALHLRASVTLVDAAAFYARQRQRSFWFGAIVVLAALVALSGYLVARQAFLRQLALNEMQANFISSVSHELRSPLAALRLLAEGLQRGKVTEHVRQQEYFRLMVDECRRLSGMIENVLTLARSDRQQQNYDREPTDLPRLVRETVTLIDPVAAERDVLLQTRLPAECPTSLLLDGRAVQQALVNLIDNAIKHSPAGETVLIGVDALPSGVRLSVQDSGPGIPPHDHQRIFERFYRRGSELRRETPGIGIGLSIVKQIVEDLGGRVWVESEPGKGSTFIMEFLNGSAVGEDRGQKTEDQGEKSELRGQSSEKSEQSDQSEPFEKSDTRKRVR